MIEKNHYRGIDNPYVWEDIMVDELRDSIKSLTDCCLYTIEAKRHSGKTTFLNKLCNNIHKAYCNVYGGSTVSAPSILYIGKNEIMNTRYKRIAEEKSPSVSVYTSCLTEELLYKLPSVIDSLDMVLVDDMDMADNELLYQLTKIVYEHGDKVLMVMVGATEQETREAMEDDDKSTWIMLLNHPIVCNLSYVIRKETPDEKILFDHTGIEESLKSQKPDRKKKDTASIDELLSAALSGPMKEFEETEQIEDEKAFLKLLGIDEADDPVILNIDEDDIQELIDFLKKFKKNDQ